MFDRIERLQSKKLVGQSLEMSLQENRTHELWSSFMPRKKEILNQKGQNLFSMQVYDQELNFKDFNPTTSFTKWAAAEVADFNDIPESMNSYVLQGGLYAVFIHKGTPASFPKTAQYIFSNWLPTSDYELDKREHFELLSEKSKRNDPDSEEEVWIPVKEKKTHIAVTGGTGHLGRNLIDLLLKQGQSVKALKRTSKTPFEHPNLTWILGDLNDQDALQTLLGNSNALIHSASAISLGELDQDYVYDVNVNGTSNLIKAALGRDIKFIYISSSTSVTDPLGDEIFDEDRPYKKDTRFHYAYTKAIAEQEVLKAVETNDLNACIIRPTAIFGPTDHIPSRFGATILDIYNRKLPFITDGGYNMIDVRDLSQTIINSISMGKQGGVYLTGGEYISLEDLSKLIKPSKIPMKLSVDLLISILPVINLYDKLFKLKWPVSRESLYTLKFSPKKMDSSKAAKELLHQSRPIKNTIEDLLEWFKEKN